MNSIVGFNSLYNWYVKNLLLTVITARYYYAIVISHNNYGNYLHSSDRMKKIKYNIIRRYIFPVLSRELFCLYFMYDYPTHLVEEKKNTNKYYI